MFGTNEQFNLERLPFSVAGAYMSVYQDVNDKNMYVTVTRGTLAILDRPNLMRIQPMVNGEAVPFVYDCTASKLTLRAKQGTAEFTFEKDPAVMRVRANGIAVEFGIDFLGCEDSCILPDGDVELCFNRVGKIKIARISGALTKALPLQCPGHGAFTMCPAEGEQTAEIAITDFDSACPHRDDYLPFDAVVADKQAEFDEFCKNYGDVPAAYKEMAVKAKFMVWHSYLGNHGSMEEPLVYMHKLYMNRAFGWQQVFHSLAMSKNAKEAWRLMIAFFQYQNDIGGLPDHVSDIGQTTYLTTKPPIQGYAIIKILDNFDTSALTKEDYQEMYDRMTRYLGWWFTYHDHSGTGCPAYYHPDESGYDEASAFNRGIPVISPDLVSYTVFNCEACARLARILGDEEKGAYWDERAKYFVDYLVEKLWDGEQFLEYLPREKELYKCGSIPQLQPIMLGKRLPREITDILAKRLCDPEEYLTDYGVATEHLKSDKVIMRAFTRGTIVAPTELFIINGLKDAGYEEEAEDICITYLNALMHTGLALGIHPYRIEPVSGNVIISEATGLSVSHPFSSWVGSVFLQLAQLMV